MQRISIFLPVGFMPMNVPENSFLPTKMPTRPCIVWPHQCKLCQRMPLEMVLPIVLKPLALLLRNRYYPSTGTPRLKIRQYLLSGDRLGHRPSAQLLLSFTFDKSVFLDK